MKDKIQQLSILLAEEEPERLEDFNRFWKDWFNGVIPGEKHTLIAEKEGKIVGVARLWKTPHLSLGYLVEGLQVARDYRKQGVGKKLLKDAENYLREKGEQYIYSGTYEDNTASIKTHLSAGFVLDSREPLNSFGHYHATLKCFKKRL